MSYSKLIPYTIAAAMLIAGCQSGGENSSAGLTLEAPSSSMLLDSSELQSGFSVNIHESLEIITIQYQNMFIEVDSDQIIQFNKPASLNPINNFMFEGLTLEQATQKAKAYDELFEKNEVRLISQGRSGYINPNYNCFAYVILKKFPDIPMVNRSTWLNPTGFTQIVYPLLQNPVYSDLTYEEFSEINDLKPGNVIVFHRKKLDDEGNEILELVHTGIFIGFDEDNDMIVESKLGSIYLIQSSIEFLYNFYNDTSEKLEIDIYR